jgi:hypothetical protein
MQTKNAASPSPKTPTTKGLAASKYAEDVGAAPASSAVEGEHDSSSAALASVRQPSLNPVSPLEHFFSNSSQPSSFPSS